MKTYPLIVALIIAVSILSCEKDENITYPKEGRFGLNLLNETDTVYSSGGRYSVAANIPEGEILRIEFSQSGSVAIHISSRIGWISIRGNDGKKYWETSKTGEVDMEVELLGSTTISFYKNNSETPYRMKEIYLE